MKKQKNIVRAVLSAAILIVVLMRPIPVCASQSSVEVAVIIQYRDYATGDEVYVGTRDYDSEGNSVIRISQMIAEGEDGYDSVDFPGKENAATASFQVDGGEKEPANWSERGILEEREDGVGLRGPCIRSGHYYTASETALWNADTVITVSDVEIPEGYTEVDEAGIYTVVFGQNNYEQIQAILNGTEKDSGEAIYIYVPVYISDGTEPIAEAEETAATDGMEGTETDAASEKADEPKEADASVQDITEAVEAGAAAAEDNNSGSGVPRFLLPAGAVVLAAAVLLILLCRRRKGGKK